MGCGWKKDPRLSLTSEKLTMLQKCNISGCSRKSTARCKVVVIEMYVVLLMDGGYSAPGTFADGKEDKHNGSSED